MSIKEIKKYLKKGISRDWNKLSEKLNQIGFYQSSCDCFIKDNIEIAFDIFDYHYDVFILDNGELLTSDTGMKVKIV